MKRGSSTLRSLGATLVLVLSVWYTPAASGANFVVTNYGTDSSGCGVTTNPCRSISQAIENASSQDAIWVGAGHYGDLTGDGSFADPGEEHATARPQDYPYKGCIVCVTKSLRIYSFNGAAVTFIDSGPSRDFQTTVRLDADGTIFGSAGHGFTITGGNAVGVLIDREGRESMSADIIVTGNVDLKDGIGFLINGMQGPPFRCPPPFQQLCAFKPNAQVMLQGNQAVGSGTGFAVIQNYEPVGYIKFVMQRNLALGTGTGFKADGGLAEFACAPAGYCTSAPVATYLYNVAVGGSVGFSLPGTGAVRGNTASGNVTAGYLLQTSGTLFQQNSAIGNDGPGAIVGVGDPSRPPAVIDQFYGNNFYGNDRNRPPITVSNGPVSFPLGPSARCGVVNVGALLFITGSIPAASPPFPAETLQAPSNFWGAANGPHSNGPGDAAGGACDFNGGTTIAGSSLTAPAAITSFP
jgi:hypothetical protein